MPKRPSKNPSARENQLINRAQKPAKTGLEAVKVSVGFPPAEIGVDAWRWGFAIGDEATIGAGNLDHFVAVVFFMLARWAR